MYLPKLLEITTVYKQIIIYLFNSFSMFVAISQTFHHTYIQEYTFTSQTLHYLLQSYKKEKKPSTINNSKTASWQEIFSFSNPLQHKFELYIWFLHQMFS